MPKRTRDYNEWLIKRLADPQYAERYLRTAKADSNEMFLKALRKVAEAKKMAKVAEETGLNRESLYKSLSQEGNPGLSTVEAVLNTVGMTLMPELKQVTAPALAGTPSQPTKTSTAELGSSGSNRIIDFAGTWTTTENVAGGLAEDGGEQGTGIDMLPAYMISAQTEEQEAAGI